MYQHTVGQGPAGSDPNPDKWCWLGPRLDVRSPAFAPNLTLSPNPLASRPPRTRAPYLQSIARCPLPIAHPLLLPPP
jgi:hypothetical protein